MNPRIELINTGTELLLGSVVNTHLKFLAEAFFPLGLRIGRQVTVPDGHEIRSAVLESFPRADIVILTGGLGPTTDDITREIVAELLGLELIHDPEVMAAITERFARRGMVPNERVALQALRPAEATVLPNHYGTAPGLYFPPIQRSSQGQLAPESHPLSPHLFLLPGPPKELKPMVTDSVLPILRTLVPAGTAESKRVFRVTGLGESYVEEQVGPDLLALGIELGYCARPGQVDLRIIGPDPLLDQAQRIIIDRLGAHIASHDERSLEKVVLDLLEAQHKTLATAESCTGGLLAHSITNVPGASSVFLGGLVTYANECKIRQLGVDPALIQEHGAVSAQVASAMAQGAARVTGADFALSTTGIAGPGGGSPQKPVGTVYMALANASSTLQVQLHSFPSDRETFKLLAAQAAFELLRRHLVGASLQEPSGAIKSGE